MWWWSHRRSRDAKKNDDEPLVEESHAIGYDDHYDDRDVEYV